jgi:hypothetical protein
LVWVNLNQHTFKLTLTKNLTPLLTSGLSFYGYYLLDDNQILTLVDTCSSS